MLSKYEKIKSDWEPWEDSFLQLVFMSENNSEISKILKRPTKHITKRAQFLQLKKVEDINLIGKKFNSLLVIDKANKPETIKYSRYRFWLCQCRCGKQIISDTYRLIGLGIYSCGCLSKPNKARIINRDYICRIRNRAKKNKMEFDLSLEFLENLLIQQNYRCAISGLLINFPKGGNFSVETTASLDRIDSKQGYIENNVQWVHKDVNWMKQDYSDEYFIEMCRIITDNNK